MCAFGKDIMADAADEDIDAPAENWAQIMGRKLRSPETLRFQSAINTLRFMWTMAPCKAQRFSLQFELRFKARAIAVAIGWCAKAARPRKLLASCATTRRPSPQVFD